MTLQHLLKMRDSIHVHFWEQQGWVFYSFALLSLLVIGFAINIHRIPIDKVKEFKKWEKIDDLKKTIHLIIFVLFTITSLIGFLNYESDDYAQREKWVNHDVIPYIQQHKQSYIVENYQIGTNSESNVVNITDDPNRIGVTVAFQDKNRQVEMLNGDVKVFKTNKKQPYVTMTYIQKDLIYIDVNEDYTAGYYEPTLYIPETNHLNVNGKR